MVAKVILTLVWAAVLVLANMALDSAWAQYVATFALGGIYAFAMSKVARARRRADRD
jgi:hypothetical protein